MRAKPADIGDGQVVIETDKSYIVIVRVRSTDANETAADVLTAVRGALSYAQAFDQFPRTYDVAIAGKQLNANGDIFTAIARAVGNHGDAASRSGVGLPVDPSPSVGQPSDAAPSVS